MNAVEEELIAFLADRRGVPEDVVRPAYLDSRDAFQFSSQRYRRLLRSLHRLYAPIYGEENDDDLISAYQFHSASYLFRAVGYSFDRLPKYEALAEYLLSIVDEKPPIVVDYGCGLAYTSLALAFQCPGAEIYLVDIDTLVLDFAEYRFRQRGLRCTPIRIGHGNTYPELPRHNICLATEVMEHLREPLMAYGHIVQSMSEGGILMGNFADHDGEMFHVSPRLDALRSAIAVDYLPLEHDCYRKAAR